MTYEKVADDGVIFLWHFSKVSINDLFSHALIILAMTRAFRRYPTCRGPLEHSGLGSGHATTRARATLLLAIYELQYVLQYIVINKLFGNHQLFLVFSFLFQ